MNQRMHIHGLARLLRTLQKLPEELQRGPLSEATDAAAEVIQAQAVQNAPTHTGLLKESIKRRQINKTDPTMAQFRISVDGQTPAKKFRSKSVFRTLDTGPKGPATEGAYYAFWIEFGREGQAAKPFMRPAFDQQKERAVLVFRDKFRAAVLAAVAKHGGRSRVQ